MDNICIWNVRGLNSPRKQKVVKEFITQHSMGLVGLLETKVKLQVWVVFIKLCFQIGVLLLTLLTIRVGE